MWWGKIFWGDSLCLCSPPLRLPFWIRQTNLEHSFLKPPSIFPLHLLTPPSISMCSESCTVETRDGVKLHTRVFKPKDPSTNLAIIIVHPYSIMGGCQVLMKGIAVGLAERGYKSVTFDMRGAGRSKGRASLTGSSEILDVIAVCRWFVENTAAERILLVGSSAGIYFFFEILFVFFSDYMIDWFWWLGNEFDEVGVCFFYIYVILGFWKLKYEICVGVFEFLDFMIDGRVFVFSLS